MYFLENFVQFERKCSFQVPEELVYDREFLGDPADAAFVEKMNYFKLRGVGRDPLKTDDRSRNIVVRIRILVSGRRPLHCWPVRVDWCHSKIARTFGGAHETGIRMSGVLRIERCC